MGGSVSYRYGKKINAALENGATADDLSALLRERETAMANEKSRKEFREHERQLASEFTERVKAAKPLSQRPKGVSMQDWKTENPDLDKGLRLLKRAANILRGQNRIIHMPKPVDYDSTSQILTYNESDRDAVEQAIRETEKELKIDLGFALDRIQWVS